MAYTWNIYARHRQTLLLEVSCIVYAKLFDQYSPRGRAGCLSDGVLGSILPMCVGCPARVFERAGMFLVGTSNSGDEALSELTAWGAMTSC